MRFPFVVNVDIVYAPTMFPFLYVRTAVLFICLHNVHIICCHLKLLFFGLIPIQCHDFCTDIHTFNRIDGWHAKIEMIQKENNPFNLRLVFYHIYVFCSGEMSWICMGSSESDFFSESMKQNC